MLGNSKLVAELQAKNETLEASLGAAIGEKAAIQAELETAHASFAAAEPFKAKHSKASAALKGVRANLVAIAGADVTIEANEDEDESDTESRACASLIEGLTTKASVDALVTQRLAAAGVEGIKRDPNAKDSTGSAEAPKSELTGLAKARAALAAKSKK